MIDLSCAAMPDIPLLTTLPVVLALGLAALSLVGVWLSERGERGRT